MEKKAKEGSVEDIIKSIRGIIGAGPKKSSDDEGVLELTERIPANEDSFLSAGAASSINRDFRDFAERASAAPDIKRDKRSMLLEDLVTDTVKEYLKEWMEENLPRLVQKVIEKELRKLLPEERKKFD